MAYCRWSSDNWQSDIYAYEGKEGYITHVASVRVVGDIPPLPAWDDPSFGEAYKMQSKAVSRARRRPIGLACDGQDFWDATLEGLLARLLELREMGYHMPESALDTIRREMAEPGKEQL